MSNLDIARMLREVAAAYSIKNEGKYRFQIIAYQKAADSIESTTSEVKHLVEEDKLATLPGVGPSLQEHLKDLLKTGKVKRWEELFSDMPKAMFPLLDIPSFGPKTAYKLVNAFSLSDPKTVIADLKTIAESGKIAELEGFGQKSQDDILRAIAEYHTGIAKNVRMVYPFAHELAEKILEYLKKSPNVIEAYPLGSLRRKRDTIGDIDIAVSTKNPEKVIKHFVDYPYKERIIEQGPASASIFVAGGKHVDLMAQPPEGFGALLQHFSGSKEHNVTLREYALKQGWSLSEKGIKDKKTEKITEYDTEEAFYHGLGMDWVPPEMREDHGEVKLALEHKLPQLIELKDMKGDLHIHSSFPIEPSHDLGRDSMEDMMKYGKKLGYDYLGFSEHNPSVSKHTSEQIYGLIAKRNENIEHILLSMKDVRVFKLLETDILANGDLGVDSKGLDLLDGTLVSIHSSFSMSKADMTKRVLNGLAHPKAKIFAHPTGRLINQRPSIELDWDKIFDFCQKNNKALEINAAPSRLDLPDSLVFQAMKYGIKFTIDTDSHAIPHMDLMQYGISVARRGWVTKDAVLNCMAYNDLISWFRS